LLTFSKFGRCLSALALAIAHGLSAQAPSHPTDLATSTPKNWVEAAAVNEERIINDDGSFPLRYRTRKVDAKGDTTRDNIESRQGTVARLVQRNGEPLTAEEDAAERARLTDMLDSPNDFIRHHKRDSSARGYSLELVRQMPQAMIFTYVPGQPQLPGVALTQIVIDFTPDPHYHPPSFIAETLTGLQGRVWIDRKTLHVVRIEGHILHTVNFGWGMLGKLYPGGTVEFEQSNAGGDRWAYSHLRTNLSVRALIKTVQWRESMDAADFQILPASLDYRDAIHILLESRVALR
jgi:hypothetical protein